MSCNCAAFSATSNQSLSRLRANTHRLVNGDDLARLAVQEARPELVSPCGKRGGSQQIQVGPPGRTAPSEWAGWLQSAAFVLQAQRWSPDHRQAASCSGRTHAVPTIAELAAAAALTVGGGVGAKGLAGSGVLAGGEVQDVHLSSTAMNKLRKRSDPQHPSPWSGRGASRRHAALDRRLWLEHSMDLQLHQFRRC